MTPKKSEKTTTEKKDLRQVRTALHGCIEDCEGEPVERLRYKIDHARSAQDLWLLRNDAYQIVSIQASQTEAVKRINALLPVFEGWVDARQMTAIR